MYPIRVPVNFNVCNISVIIKMILGEGEGEREGEKKMGKKTERVKKNGAKKKIGRKNPEE